MKKHLKFLALYALWIAGIVWILGGCSGSKTAADMEAVEALKQQVESRHIRVKAEWAVPLATAGLASVMNAGLMQPGNNISRINLLNTPNSFEMRGDSVYIDLPYYGERQIVTNYPGGQGISFTGLIENYRAKRNAKDNSYRITFDTSDKSERYDVNVSVYPGQRALVVFYSNQRNTIRYEGVLENPQSE